MDEEYYQFEGEEDVVIGGGAISLRNTRNDDTEHREILQELKELHYRDQQEDNAHACYLELEEYQLRYAVPIFNNMSFYDFVEAFFL